MRPYQHAASVAQPIAGCVGMRHHGPGKRLRQFALVPPDIVSGVLIMHVLCRRAISVGEIGAQSYTAHSPVQQKRVTVAESLGCPMRLLDNAWR